jgi:phosphoglycerate-specific signal transduction histidine kinase
MKVLGNLRIGARLALAFGFVPLLMGAIVAVGAKQLGELDCDQVAIVDQRVPLMIEAFDVRAAASAMAGSLLTLMAGKDPAKIRREIHTLKRVRHGADRIASGSQQAFWQEYRFTDPVMRKVEPGEMHCERRGDAAVFGGVYRH